MLELVVAMALTTASGDPPAGIGEALAKDRASRISDLRYRLELKIPAAQDEAIYGTARLRFALAGKDRALVLDFAPPAGHVLSVTSNGTALKWRWANGHIVIEKPATDIEIRFRAGEASLNRNPDFLYSLFVPARAHLAIPCFDQPDIKARYEVKLIKPVDWQALTNAEPGVETKPIPTYLLHFAAGKFQVLTQTRGGRTINMFHRETDPKKVARNKEAIFDLHFQALRWMEEYTGIPYPFGKFDFMALPAFQFGGMEHPGAISYNANGLFLDESATQAQLLGRASVISHETAHMWFGDLVTMKWFNDVWLKEVFANLMAAKMVNPSFPNLNHDLRFFLAHYRTAYNVDRTPGSNAIRQSLANLNEAGSMYGPIIYQKAPIVMRQLEAQLGEDNFRDGLREYLRRYSYSNATWGGLIAILDPRTPRNLAVWSKAWVDSPGRPRIRTILKEDAGKVSSLAFRQSGAQRQRIDVYLGAKKFSLDVGPGLTALPAAAGLPTPDFILPDGYAGFDLDGRSRSYLLKHLPEISDGRIRASAWSALWELMLDEAVAPAEMFEAAIASLQDETEELNVQRLAGDLQNIYWKRLDDRAKYAERVESLLRQKIERAPNRSLRATYFQAFRDMAMTKDGVHWLKQLWLKDRSIPDLPLAETDYTRIAAELALRQTEGWRDILATQLQRIQNPDRKAQFAFVIPSLDSDPAIRANFFAGLEDPRNRDHEPWVLEGLGYLHHPLRAEMSERFIDPSLAMLREIQKTGDIFFPQRWMAATLNGHRGGRAAAIVQTFLANLPADYPPRLRLTVLVAADDLLRRQSKSRASSADKR